jgi:aldose 1-epimerase
LVIELLAETDAPTLCNLAHHSYFNLDDGGRTDALQHRIEIDAGAYLPVDAELIPTGDVFRVAGTPFDLSAPQVIRNGEGASHSPYDHNFCLASARGALRHAARLQAARSGVEMEVWTTEPGVQFYDGGGISCPVPGLDAIQYGRHAGICLEPQVWPDAPNRAYFPQALLVPGESYSQTTEYRFRLAH